MLERGLFVVVIEVAQKLFEFCTEVIGAWDDRLRPPIEFSFKHGDIHCELRVGGDEFVVKHARLVDVVAEVSTWADPEHMRQMRLQ